MLQKTLRLRTNVRVHFFCPFFLCDEGRKEKEKEERKKKVYAAAATRHYTCVVEYETWKMHFGIYPNNLRAGDIDSFDQLGAGKAKEFHAEELKNLMEISHLLLNCKDAAVLKALEDYREALTNFNVPEDTVKQTKSALYALVKTQGIDAENINKETKAAAKAFFDEIQQVVPGLYIGGEYPASNLPYLQKHKITHIVRATETAGVTFAREVKYLKVEIPDDERADIKAHFEKTNEFIDTAITSGHTVLVHCMAGISRSASIVLAFLVGKRNLSLDSAFHLLKTCRPYVFPNSGFRKQLRDFEKTVRGTSNMEEIDQ